MFLLSHRLFPILAIALLLSWPAQDLLARGGRGSFGGSSSSRVSRPSFSSSSSSSSSSRSSGSSSRSSWGSSSSSSSGWGSSSSNRSPYSTSQSDSSLSTKVNRGGTSQSRGEAIDSRSSPSTSGPTYDSSPSRNPTTSSTSTSRTSSVPRIPQGMTLPDGRYAPVYMDQSRGGYGFWDSMGKWILISSVLNNMNRGSYQPGYQPSYPVQTSGDYQGGYSPSRSGSSGGGAVLAVIGLVVLGVLVTAGIYMHRAGSNSKPRPFDARFTPPTGGNPMSPSTTTGGALTEWVSLSPGAFVTLSDQQALEDSQKRGTGLQGIDYKVESVGVIKDLEGFATWVLANLNDGNQKLVLMVKGDETHVDHRVYFPSEDFRPAKREAVINRGDTWLFEAPADPNNFKPSHLRYTAEIPYSTDGTEMIYVRKDQGERHGDYTEKPALGGLGAMVATVVEYAATERTENPELLILEIATTTQKTGEVSLYLGCPVRPSEVSIVKAA